MAKRKKPKYPPPRKGLSPLAIIAVIAGILGGAATGLLIAVHSDMPSIEALADYRPPAATKVYSDDNRLIGEFFQENRKPLTYDKIPKVMVDAIVAVEDAEFFEHKGVRVLSMVRALIADIKARKFVQGGSTITQQLAKTLFLTPEKSISRKIKEMLLALQIETRYTKEEILTYYFNQIYFGEGRYGLEAAAEVYFGKPAAKLTVAEAALIAGLPKAPSYYSPYKGLARSVKRRNIVLKRMVDEKLITPEQYEAAVKSEPELAGKGGGKRAQWFLEAVRQRAEGWIGGQLYRGGVSVYTTLDLDLQEAAEAAIAEGLAAMEKKIAAPYIDKKIPEKYGDLQAALIAIDPKSGEIKAMVGGRSFSDSQFNRATMARRQPGSAFKPIVYLAALENGGRSSDLLLDSPIILEMGGKDWKPANFSNKFYGDVTMRNALAKSLNLATVRLFQQVGAEAVIDTATRLGIKSELVPYPSLALGSSEVTLKELVSAYSVLANYGLRYEPFYVKHINRADGARLYKSGLNMSEAVSPENSFLATTLLRAVVEEGTGKQMKELGTELAGKTGTTDDYSDAWFVGYSPSLAVGVWVGFDKRISMGRRATGAGAAGPIWKMFMERVVEKRGAERFEMPEGIIAMEVDSETGKRASGKCPVADTFYYTIGNEPTEYCDH